MKFNYRTVKITKIVKETPRVNTYTLDAVMNAKPGQYVMLWIPGENEKPFGVVANNPLQLSIARVGPFTEKVHKLKVGDVMTIRGPNGSAFRILGRRPLLVGGGYGVVPLFLLAQSFTPAIRKKTVVVIGAKTTSDLAFVSRFAALGCTVKISTDDGSVGHKGFSTDLAQNILKTEKIDSMYACGPELMMKKVARMAKDKRIPSQVSIERHFKCGGMGLCGSCHFNGKLVCVDGPVFPGNVLL